MTTYYRPDPDAAPPFEELYVGAYVTIGGERRLVTRMTAEEVLEDDDELGLKAGDLKWIVETEAAPPPAEPRVVDEL